MSATCFPVTWVVARRVYEKCGGMVISAWKICDIQRFYTYTGCHNLQRKRMRIDTEQPVFKILISTDVIKAKNYLLSLGIHGEIVSTEMNLRNLSRAWVNYIYRSICLNGYKTACQDGGIGYMVAPTEMSFWWLSYWRWSGRRSSSWHFVKPWCMTITLFTSFFS